MYSTTSSLDAFFKGDIIRPLNTLKKIPQTSLDFTGDLTQYPKEHLGFAPIFSPVHPCSFVPLLLSSFTPLLAPPLPPTSSLC